MTLIQKLINWQQDQARKEHLEPYMVVQFNTIKEIARLQPKTHDDLIRIKGIGPAKVRKYGDDILGIVRGNGIVAETVQTEGVDLFAEASAVNEAVLTSKVPQPVGMAYDKETGEIIEDADDTVTVTEFVTMLDTMLRTNFRSVRVQGEVVGFKKNANGHAYFEIKDKESVLRCAVFRSSYELSGVTLEDGMEIVVTGYPNYHKKYGFSFVGTTVELYGEGALKKAYDELKKKLDAEGLFAPEKKQPVPQLPEKIGLITSRTGAAIGDFTSNVGQYGYKIIFHHTSVEGAHALREIRDALELMAKKDLDVLVLVRGGGSLESLQAFNNEKIVRMIADFPVPVIVGVGHEQDETITTLVADVGASTPTAAAHAVRESWDTCEKDLQKYQNDLLNAFTDTLRMIQDDLMKKEDILIQRLSNIIVHFQNIFNRFAQSSARIDAFIKNYHTTINFLSKKICDIYDNQLNNARASFDSKQILTYYVKQALQYKERLMFFERSLAQHDPQRQLALGYSITRNKKGDLIRTKSTVKKDENLTVQFVDGKIKTIVTDV